MPIPYASDYVALVYCGGRRGTDNGSFGPRTGRKGMGGGVGNPSFQATAIYISRSSKGIVRLHLNCA